MYLVYLLSLVRPLVELHPNTGLLTAAESERSVNSAPSGYPGMFPEMESKLFLTRADIYDCVAEVGWDITTVLSVRRAQGKSNCSDSEI